MPVIINEFEIVTEPPEAPTPDTGAPPQTPEAAAPLRPEDVARIQRYHYERMERLRAD